MTDPWAIVLQPFIPVELAERGNRRLKHNISFLIFPHHDGTGQVQVVSHRKRCIVGEQLEHGLHDGARLYNIHPGTNTHVRNRHPAQFSGQ